MLPGITKIIRNMKSNLSFTICVLFLSSFFISCQKEIVVDDLPGAVSLKLKTYIEDARNTPYNSIDTFNVTYDSQDRILSLVSNSSGGKFLYEYNMGNYALEIKDHDHVIIRDVSYINGAGLVDSTFQVNDTQDSSTSKLIYNLNKQVIEERSYIYSLVSGATLDGISYYTYDANGNATTYVEKTASGEMISTTTYTYNNILNTVFLTPSYHPLPFKNLPITKSVYFPGSGSETSTTEYTLDSSNRVIMEKETVAGGVFVIKRYEYY